MLGKLRKALDPYISAGRRAGSASSGSRTSAPRKRAARNPDVAAIRAWAKSNGYSLSERGRVPASVVRGDVEAGGGRVEPGDVRGVRAQGVPQVGVVRVHLTTSYVASSWRSRRSRTSQ